MADRSSAGIFGDLFIKLAKPGPVDKGELAKWLWRKAKDFDFSEDQMGADKALVTLGLAHECPDCRAIVYSPTMRCEDCRGG